MGVRGEPKLRKYIPILLFLIVLTSCAAPQRRGALLTEFPERPIFEAAISDIGKANDIDVSKISLYWGDGSTIIITDDDKIIVGYDFLYRYRCREGKPEYIYCFVAHELAHYKLSHLGKRKAASYVTTALMLGLNMVVPGAGLLNLGLNPMVTSGYSRSQELEADSEAVKFMDKQGVEGARGKYIEALRWIYVGSNPKTGLMATHPQLEDRIGNLN